MQLLLLAIPFLCILSSCGRVGGVTAGEDKDDRFGELPEVPSHLRAGGGNANVKIEPAQARIVAAGVDPASLATDAGGIEGLPSESDLIFTDPDDVEGSEAAIQGLFGTREKNWLESHTEAKNLSLLESKPLLILFTDLPSPSGGGSPTAARLQTELLARNDFSAWAKDHLVRLRLDFNLKDRKSADLSKQSLALRKEKFLKSLKKQYKIGGFPAMLVVSTDGSVLQHIRGYRSGSADYTWGLLKTAVVNSKQRQEVFEARLLKKGYRRWQGQNENKILARLVSYREGELILIGPNGKRYQTHENNLSPQDREWIKEQKEKRKRS